MKIAQEYIEFEARPTLQADAPTTCPVDDASCTAPTVQAGACTAPRIQAPACNASETQLGVRDVNILW
jgi:hypothetical protein